VDYAPLLAEIKTRVQSARVKAGLAANRKLLAQATLAQNPVSRSPIVQAPLAQLSWYHHLALLAAPNVAELEKGLAGT
jgi:hypothetical protein